MPLNELEKHPYLNYNDNLGFGKDYFKGLIIGTFPIYDITQPFLNGPIRSGDNAALQFFYGSNENGFWNTICKTFNVLERDNPLFGDKEFRVEKAKALLANHRLIITDVVEVTNRHNIKKNNGFCPLDSSLFNNKANDEIIKEFKLNHNIDNMLKEHNAVEFLYFTAIGNAGISPFGLFKKIFRKRLTIIRTYNVANRLFGMELSIDKRKYQAFMLPSPAGDGLRGIQWTDQRRTVMFINYVQRIDIDFFNQIKSVSKKLRTHKQMKTLTRLREAFFAECWRQAFVNNNINFQG